MRKGITEPPQQSSPRTTTVDTKGKDSKVEDSGEGGRVGAGGQPLDEAWCHHHMPLGLLFWSFSWTGTPHVQPHNPKERPNLGYVTTTPLFFSLQRTWDWMGKPGKGRLSWTRIKMVFLWAPIHVPVPTGKKWSLQPFNESDLLIQLAGPHSALRLCAAQGPYATLQNTQSWPLCPFDLISESLPHLLLLPFSSGSSASHAALRKNYL